MYSEKVVRPLPQKNRESNLELLRIIAMMAIVAHHYVVNSGIELLYDFQCEPLKSTFLQIWGMGGKTGINVFVLITGYFMCTMKLTWKRYLKIFLKWTFYAILFYVIFVITGYEALSLKRVLKLIFGTARNINNGFTAFFLMFYLFIPFLNKLLNHLSRKEVACLISLLLFMYTFLGTFLLAWFVYTYIGWYITLYFLAAYFRMYPTWWSQNRRLAGIMLITSILLAWGSIIFFRKAGILYPHYMLVDSHKFLALVIALSAFLFFKNTNIAQNRFINTVSGTTFGVLCIHANSDAMRTFLWKDLLCVPEQFHLPLYALAGHALLSLLGVFVVCSCIDYMVGRVLEAPLFRWFDTHQQSIEATVKRYGQSIANTWTCGLSKAEKFFQK